MDGVVGGFAIIIAIVFIEILSWRIKMLNVYFLKHKWKNVPNRSEQCFIKKTWLEEQVLFYIIWIGNAMVLNISEFQCGKICLDMCDFVNIPEYEWNITRLNKSEF